MSCSMFLVFYSSDMKNSPIQARLSSLLPPHVYCCHRAFIICSEWSRGGKGYSMHHFLPACLSPPCALIKRGKPCRNWKHAHIYSYETTGRKQKIKKKEEEPFFLSSVPCTEFILFTWAGRESCGYIKVCIMSSCLWINCTGCLCFLGFCCSF